MDFRKVARIAVNVLTLILAVLTHPMFGSMIPVEWLPNIASITAVINTVLSMMRWATVDPAAVTTTDK